MNRARRSNIVYVDFHEPLPAYDPHWATTLTFLVALCWVLALAAFAWMMSL